jgi:glycosyltransferase involved in cell wall biosynthesis
MRILIVVLSPISAELGAAQVALNLADGLRTQGVEAVLWSPRPIPEDIRWWRQMSWMRQRLNEFVKDNGPFDVVDAPPVALTRVISKCGTVIARSVQPDLLYLWTETRHARLARREAFARSIARRVVEQLHTLYLAALVVNGWFWARHILCLGSGELGWMKKWFPWWRRKMSMYVNAIGDEERKALAAVRQNRSAPSGNGTRFLWLGRWTAHKGIDSLVAFIRQRMQENSTDMFTIAGYGDKVVHPIGPELLNFGRIQLVPSYGRRELTELLRTHDAGLFTSLVEGWGLSLQEMLESGMPVYATETGAVHDLRDEFPGLLRGFPPPRAVSGDFDCDTCIKSEYFDRFSWKSIAANYLAMIRGS